MLDDARVVNAGLTRLYRNPVEIIKTEERNQIPDCLAELRGAAGRGLHAAGWISYDAGPPGESCVSSAYGPLLWFGLFSEYQIVKNVPTLLPDPAGAWAGPPVPQIDVAGYEEAFTRVKKYIVAGDIYQANLTFQTSCAVLGDPLALYARIRGHAAAGWGGIVFDGRHTFLSFSPELFFRLNRDQLEARPMKGTAKRFADRRADAATATALPLDEKQRAENLMIVDLLRNDLSRVAIPGSVKVPALFTVETYPTVHQLTSTIVATLADGADAISVLEACFPCGSITGAPKLRAIEIAAEVEAGPRGIYTGTIGHIDQGGDAAFNVAIRTMVLKDLPSATTEATLGIGSAIVADSTCEAEWQECLLKGAFISSAMVPFDLVETMRFEVDKGILDLDRHFVRLRGAAAAFAFYFEPQLLIKQLQAATSLLLVDSRVRLQLSRSGNAVIDVQALPHTPIYPIIVPIVPLPVSENDFRLQYKTSDRSFYDSARANYFEVLFVRNDGLLTEGSFTNLFVPREDGILLTPSLRYGLQSGVLRQRLIEQGAAVEADLMETDLKSGFKIGNAVRGLLNARLP
ncbi:aminodeoxychorismate synthase component I [Sphingomonas sp. UYEF23]|uniref:aminodeoxychorismate synthase component I n=1 Tax=Sphingomonas sp. UYEF23 TaxID=1756408 RepID=UPI003395DE90